jgi:phospholipid/cholesterol/gamma-HCH transport system permease protein
VDASPDVMSTRPQLHVTRPSDDTLLVQFSGSWCLQDELPATVEVEQALEAEPSVRRMALDAQGVTAWDTGLLTFLLRLMRQNQQRHIDTDQTGLPEGMQRLLALATAVPEREGAARSARRTPLLARIGSRAIAAATASREMIDFIGEAALAFIKMLRGQASFRWSDVLALMQASGSQALPIVSLISGLIGLILAFMGAIQLRQFGAQIYVADLVGIGMTREMGAVMTGIIMAGRTGAAFAAQLGTMQVNEEIDAYTTLGISPMEFLVLPRMLALVLMMPLLCVYADLLGILGGVVVATGMLDVSLVEYVNETRAAVSLTDFGLGVVKSGIFGVLIALAGCLRGMQCGRSASAVGDAATSAVVTGIVFIIATDGLLAVITEAIGI